MLALEPPTTKMEPLLVGLCNVLAALRSQDSTT